MSYCDGSLNISVNITLTDGPLSASQAWSLPATSVTTQAWQDAHSTLNIPQFCHPCNQEIVNLTDMEEGNGPRDGKKK